MLQSLNIIFFIAHTALMIFNLTGWAIPRTRWPHLICLLATMFSWFVMGATRGLGYCLCTDWHFQVRRAMGLHDGVRSYLQLLARVFTGMQMNKFTSDVLAVGGLLFAVVATTIIWRRDWLKKRWTPKIERTL